MKQSNLLFMSAAMMLASCGGTGGAEQNTALIGKSDIQIEGKRMTPEALWAMGRIGSVAVSPDEKIGRATRLNSSHASKSRMPSSA